MNKKAFTLVELIVVITILAILGTIAFVSFQDYAKYARDSVRMGDIGKIEGSLNNFSINKGFFPEPTSSTQISYEGTEAWTQGVFGKASFDMVTSLNKIPVDPLSLNAYTYSVTNKKNEFQLGAILETGLGYNKTPLIDSANAEGTKIALAYVKGNYNGQILSVSTGSIIYLLAVPSIITSDISETSLIDIISLNMLVYNNSTNLPSSYSDTDFKVTGDFDYNPNGGIIAYSGASDTFYYQLQDEDIRVAIADSIKETYVGTVVPADDSNLSMLFKTDIDTESPSSNAKILACQTIDYILNTELAQDGCKHESLASESLSDDYFALAGGLTGNDWIFFHEIDTSGNSYVVGTYEGSGEFFGESLSASGRDMFAMKLNNIGEVSWVKDISGASIFPRAIDVDLNGNLYIVGGFGGTAEIMGNTVISNGGEDYYSLKMNSSGGFEWLKTGGGTGNDRAKGVAVDSTGNPYVVGHFSTSTNIFGEPLTNTGASTDGYIAKLQSNGDKSWVKSSGITGGWTKYVAINASGDAYVSGAFSSTNATVFGLPVTSEGGYDVYVAKLDSLGVAKWIKTAGSSGYEESAIIKVSDDGSIYSVGHFGASGAASIYGTSVTAGTDDDAYIAKLNSDGSVDSIMHADTNGSEEIPDFTFNLDDNVVFIYSIDSTQTIFSQTLTAGSYLVTLDSSMSYVSILDPVNGGIEEGSIRIDSNGDYYIAGGYDASGHDIDGEILQHIGLDDMFITKLNSFGILDN